MAPAAAAAGAAPAGAAPAAAAALPNPIFEGSEKRVEIDFSPGPRSPANGLRALPRSALDELMGLAACTIVSSRTNQHLDAYVLSESSLFVYPTKWVLKTCGTTKLLSAVPRLLEMAAQRLGMEPRRCKYSRASFLFPEQQPTPYREGFEGEARFLRSHFGHLGNGGSAYVLGDMFNGLQWHVYVADAHGAEAAYNPASGRPFHKFEVCMTDLARDSARAFYRDGAFVSAAATTAATGIRDLVPGADIDDYVFEPCGYSMNGILGGGFITIHITPEDGFSYASVEVSGFDADAFDPSDLLARVAAIFRPGSLSVSLSVDAASRCGAYAWGTLASPPPGYGCQSATAQELATGGRVSYYSLGPDPLAAGLAPGDAPSRSASPASVLRHMPSFSSAPSSAADSGSCDDRSVSSGDEGEGAAERRARDAAMAWAAKLDAAAAASAPEPEPEADAAAGAEVDAGGDAGDAAAGAEAAAAARAAARRGRESLDLANRVTAVAL
ncbi:S-adenosylmethionine decarboxylase [Raphidocelis subcapitata]|uniref:adenosylmethionine decarboxylase n=1 Tax=Raphidocelis subcapitata TaxID=307507 RepID=A0A2V0NXK3_9CHLO|nr:S-adenosylmethionine decarboxylase [Raphidocelis subcapitata]|eukprot:GBF89555.1 S-adenosylmethionine decarboxylase [Raphidocelis subcapitata]